jgi:dTDP-4-amino-4,6-dideoxygalactose transaminase
MEQVPFYSLEAEHRSIKEEVFKAINNVYDRSSFILGEDVNKFEKSFASYSGAKNCVGAASGLDALIMALKAMRVGPGDEVIVPSHTFVATALAVTHVGASPIFAEPDPNTLTLDSTNLQKKITKKTKAVIPVHLYGQPCEMDPILKICNEANIPVLADSAQAHGSYYRQQKIGTFGDVNAFSFYPTKNLGALGDGGAITTDREDLVLEIKKLRNYGSTQKYHHDIIGYNSRLDEIQAAILSIKLRGLDQRNRERQKIAGWYNESLKHVENVTAQVRPEHIESVYHLYVIQTERRDMLQRFLKEHQVETLIHYPVPIHLQDCYRHLGIKAGSLPIAEKLAQNLLSLPLFPGMSRGQVDRVCTLISDFYRRA